MANNEFTPEEILEKAKSRGWTTLAHSADKSWYSLMHESGRPINLQLYVNTNEFVLTHMKGIIKITTDTCGSFMNDVHFDRMDRQMRAIVFDLL
jgi:hypothetical protein